MFRRQCRSWLIPLQAVAGFWLNCSCPKLVPLHMSVITIRNSNTATRKYHLFNVGKMFSTYDSGSVIIAYCTPRNRLICRCFEKM
ncbi:hypothetical protein C8J55DRAFT_501865 [Lentinula edodes]|uniref:Secreted protein n=1 Tax=Lentinula lateritia TaxID=40482 RepID=A0A9W9AXU8_9AGAR|nr:hypothetical protein C8J55DRAFT_501865 [Lentinula edodes]